MTANELLNLLEALPLDQRDYPVLFVREDEPTVSWAVDNVGVTEHKHLEGIGLILLNSNTVVRRLSDDK